MNKLTWDIKYRPSSFDEFIFQDENQKQILENIQKEQTLPHLILRGHRGTGKTTVAYIIKNILKIDDYDFMIINGADENGITTVRNKVENFVSSMANSIIKIVFIDEADFLSEEAQGALRNKMETYSDNAKFIFTCNKSNKIVPEIRSRCVEIDFKTLDRDQILERLLNILLTEKIKVKNIELLESHIDAFFPDMRKIILSVQQASSTGVLQGCIGTDLDLELMVKLSSYIENDNWYEARQFISANFSKDKFDEAYRFLYDYLSDISKFKDIQLWKKGIIIIADHLYKNALVADQEINFVACLIRLANL